MTGESSKIKVSISKEEYYSSPELLSVAMKRAMWTLRLRFIRSGKLSEKEIVCWG